METKGGIFIGFESYVAWICCACVVHSVRLVDWVDFGLRLVAHESERAYAHAAHIFTWKLMWNDPRAIYCICARRLCSSEYFLKDIPFEDREKRKKNKIQPKNIG